MNNLFHLAFPVNDLSAARDFYGGVLGCNEGRSSDNWIDFDLFGHQIVAHLAPDASGIAPNGEVLVRLFLDASATSQAGYRVYLFYP